MLNQVQHDFGTGSEVNCQQTLEAPHHLRALLRVTGFLGVTLILLPPYLAVRPVSMRGRRVIEALWFAIVLRLIGLTVRVNGVPVMGRPVLFAANHVSYLDILVLGRLLDARFIAKAEVRRWPLIGFLAKISGTRFIHRVAAEAPAQNDDLAQVLKRGESLILFAEGTSSDGATVLPFKSSLFGVVERAPNLSVQPVAIRYRRLNGRAVRDAGMRARLAWFGDMTLLPHLWTVLGQMSAGVDVHFLAPEPEPAGKGRKRVAKMAESAVRQAVEAP